MNLKTKISLLFKGKNYRDLLTHCHFMLLIPYEEIIPYMNKISENIPELPTTKEDFERFFCVLEFYITMNNLRPDLYEGGYKSLKTICIIYNMGGDLERLQKKLSTLRKKAWYLQLEKQKQHGNRDGVLING